VDNDKGCLWAKCRSPHCKFTAKMHYFRNVPGDKDTARRALNHLHKRKSPNCKHTLIFRDLEPDFSSR